MILNMMKKINKIIILYIIKIIYNIIKMEMTKQYKEKMINSYNKLIKEIEKEITILKENKINDKDYEYIIKRNYELIEEIEEEINKIKM